LRILPRPVYNNREVEVRHDLELDLLVSRYMKKVCAITHFMSSCMGYVKERYLALSCVLLKGWKTDPGVGLDLKDQETSTYSATLTEAIVESRRLAGRQVNVDNWARSPHEVQMMSSLLTNIFMHSESLTYSAIVK
jgi:hypothetical protein